MGCRYGEMVSCFDGACVQFIAPELNVAWFWPSGVLARQENGEHHNMQARSPVTRWLTNAARMMSPLVLRLLVVHRVGRTGIECLAPFVVPLRRGHGFVSDKFTDIGDRCAVVDEQMRNN